MSIRDEIAELGREQDRLLTEHAEWMARREATSSPPVQKSDATAVLYRQHENTASLPVPVGVSEPSDADGRLFGDWRDEALSEAIGICLVETRKEMRAERDAALVKRDRRIAMLEGELREIKGMLGATLQLLGGGKKVAQECHDDSTVIDLPRGFIRKVRRDVA